MKNFTLFLIFSLSSFLTFSQYIEGKVLDAQTNKPVEGVNVFMKGINRGAITNEKGNYYLKFPYKIVKNDVIRFSHIAYKELEIPYNQNKKNYSVNLLIDLKKLEEIRISENRNLKKSISYKKLSSMKRGVYSFGSALYNDKIYVVGGDASYEIDGWIQTLDNYPDTDNLGDFLKKVKTNYFAQIYLNDIQVYDIKTDNWNKIDIPNLRKRAYHSINIYNNKMYILGGKWLSKGRKYEYLEDKIEIVDLKNNAIEIDYTNPHQGVGFDTYNYKDYMIVLGGSIKKKNNGFKEYSNKVHLYDLKTGNWYQIGNMPIAKEVKGILINDKIYLIGGFNKKPLAGIETFDLLTQKWKKEGSLFYGIRKPAISLKDNIIYFFEDGKISTYNVLTKELNEYLIDLFLEASEMYYANDKLYILGGFRKNNYSLYPSKGLFSIDISEFDTTKIHNLKTL